MVWCQISSSGVNIHFVHCFKNIWIHCPYLKIRRVHMRKQTSGFFLKIRKTGHSRSDSFMTAFSKAEVTLSLLNGTWALQGHVPHPACPSPFFYLPVLGRYLNLVPLLHLPSAFTPHILTVIGWIVSLQNPHEVLTTIPETVTVFGDRPFEGESRIKWGLNPIRLVSLWEDGIRMQTCTEGRPWEDPGRSQPPANQAERSQKKPSDNFLSHTFSLGAVREYISVF